MSDDADQHEVIEKSEKSGLFRIVIFALVAAVAVYGIYRITSATQGGTLEVTSGGVKFNQKPQDNFSDILAKAIEADPANVEVILSEHDYFNIKSTRLVDAVARIDAAAKENRAVTQGLREVLWDLNGPFQRPGTLTGADERLIGALEELEEVLRESGETSRLLAALWKKSLNRTGVFRPRSFEAEVKLLSSDSVADPATDDEAPPKIYACPGSEFIGKEMSIWIPDGQGGLVLGYVVEEVTKFDCGISKRNLQQLLAGQSAHLALDKDAFSALLGRVEHEDALPESVHAKFSVQPQNLRMGIVFPGGG
jgi:hypothetical protein